MYDVITMITICMHTHKDPYLCTCDSSFGNLALAKQKRKKESYKVCFAQKEKKKEKKSVICAYFVMDGQL